MFWLIWMIIVGATVVVGFLAFVLVVESIDTRGNRRRQAVREQQRSAERDMQQLVQNTISEMLNAARRFQ